MNSMQAWHNAKVTTLPLTVLALLAFAGNSVLGRLALGEAAIDPASYTAVRLVSGALTLWLITVAIGRRGSAGSWMAGALLFLYAISFSFAYVSLSTGTGALILFAAVQFTMIVAGLRSGERPLSIEWLGLSIAVAGLVYLVFPGIAAPSLGGSLLMAGAGIAWGAYSLLGRRVGSPIEATADNFLRTVPFVLAAALLQWPSLSVSSMGLLWAALSGTITSGLGYVIWYAALTRLTATRAAIVQLSVPVIAALGGVAFLSEKITWRLLISSAAILGGIGLSVSAHMGAKIFSRNRKTIFSLKPRSGTAKTDSLSGR